MNNYDYTVLDHSKIREIVSNYNTLDYAPKLRELLSGVYPAADLMALRKMDLHEKLNEIALKSYEGEQILKYRLFEAFRKSDLVGGFEVKVNQSRLDFLTINGHTTSYEIKSNLDNLDKLAKQSLDYLHAFEFNNVVIHERHLKKCKAIIPKSFGIIKVSQFDYEFVRKPTQNRAFKPKTQLSLLTKKERCNFFGMETTTDILKTFTAKQINEQFKLALKTRYQNRWNFIVGHSNHILPIDLQFFFNKNIEPHYIYS